MTLITKLDLGGTSQFLTKDAVSISLDGTKMEAESDHAITVVGDYNRMPFKDEVFKDIRGCCYAEGIVDPFELYRVAKPYARIWLRGCETSNTEADCLMQLLWRAGFKVTKYERPEWNEKFEMWEWEDGITARKEQHE